MTINKQALREVATEATQGGWYVDYDFDVCHEGGAFLAETHGDNLVQNAKFIAAANPATVLALLDELESAERQNGYLREQRDEWERKAISNFEECSEMSARIEELESQRKLAFTASNRWADKFREAERKLEAAENRIAELEARTVTLPEPFKMAKSSSGLTYYYADEVDAAIQAAGIGVKGSEICGY